jgi:glycyl-tRNA synthetase beta chain
LGGCPVKDSGLLETVAMMAEFPGVLSGSISKNFLDLPREIIITTLREHQRYFAIEDESGKLLPFFLAVHDNPLAAPDTMRPGFERVLEARLKDAEFFYNQDIKNPLEQKVSDLERVLWIKGLGSLLDKTQRLENLCVRLAEKLEPGQEQNVQPAAHLSKADLISLVVQEKEFSSLQGIMGTCYALAQGVPESAALAIREQYLPRWSDDNLPATPVGRVLALADKFDHIIGCWGAGFIPTGTKDPYALRRAAQGIIAITLDVGYHYSLNEVLKLSVQGFNSFSEKAEEIKTGVKIYIQGRMESELARRNIKPDLIQALLGVWWDDITVLVQKAETLHALRSEPGFTEKIITFSRVVNILPKDTFRNLSPGQEEKEVDTRLFSHETENKLQAACQKAGKEITDLSRAGNFRACFECLAEMKPLIDRFFNDVLVMDENEKIRRNRLNLLSNLARQIWILADFSRLAA